MILDKEHRDIPVYPFITSIDKKVVKVAEGFVWLTGYTAEELSGKTLKELSSILRLHIDISEIIYEEDLFIFTKSLETRNVQIIRGESSSEGTVYYFGERPYSRLDEKYPAMMQVQKDNTMGVAIFKMPEKILLAANQIWLNFLDKPFNEPANSFGKHISEIITGWKDSTSEQIWKDLQASGKAFRNKEYRYENFKRGETYWDASLTPVFEGGLLKYAIEITTDITEKVMQKKKLEEQSVIIRNQNEHMKAILDNMSDVIFVVDRNRSIIQYNNAAKAFFYNSQVDRKMGDSLEHTRYLDIDGNDVSLEDMPAIKILQGESVKSMRITVKRPDVTLYYNVSGSPIYDDAGNIIEALICCNDITEHVFHHEAMIEAEKREKKNLQEVLKLKDEFLYFMSHEFKTPLTVINAAIQALEHIYRKQMPDKAFEMIRKIKQNSFRQLRIVNNILDITKINAGKIKTNKANMDIVLLINLIVESVGLFAQQKGVELIFETSVKEKVIGIDEEKFERILLNLLSNAIKFTSKDKKIIIRLYIKKLSGKEMACIEVEDQGIGIPKEKQQLIFERFEQVDSTLSKQAEGTGIGLYIAKLFVEHLGGTIQLESEIGVGSTFRILLPTSRVKNANVGTVSYQVGSALVEKTAIEFSDIYL